MTFDQILGHDAQKDLLRRALNSGRLAHAYLFEGPEGVGKRLMALALVRAVFCENGSGCGNCTACRKIDHNNHPDLHIVEPEGSFIKIEQVRDLQKELSYRPLEARQKICLIDGADLMNPAAGNALLKTLEEPQGHTLMVLLSCRPEALLTTIRSRCQRIPFSRLPYRLLLNVLRDRLEIDDREAHLLAALSEGSLNKALGKDRDFYTQKRPVLLKRLLGLSLGNMAPLMELAQEIAEDKESCPDFLEILLAFYRDALLAQQGRPENEWVNLDLKDGIRHLATQTTDMLLVQIESIEACRQQIQRNVNRQLAIEVLLERLVA